MKSPTLEQFYVPEKGQKRMVQWGVNPFGDRGRIDQPERYFVRKRVLRPILHTLKQGKKVALWEFAGCFPPPNLPQRG